jgi:tetratricopeptide (TPR) repeat protein
MSNEKQIRLEVPMLSIEELQIPPPKTWEKFERLFRDLQQAELQDLDIQLNCRAGQKQKGVDVVGWSATLNGWVGMQCKVKDRNLGAILTVGELRKEVLNARKFQPPLSKYIIATTSPRDAVLQEEARKITHRHRKSGHFTVHVWAWDDVVDLLSKHDEIFHRYYGHYMLPPSSTHQPLFPERTMSEIIGRAKTSIGRVDTSAADIRVLSAPASHALGLLVTSPMPLPREAYKKLFPHVRWESLIPQLIRAKAVSMEGMLLSVSEKTKNRFLPTTADRKTFLDAWMMVLEPLRHHVDMALFLSLQYIAAEEPFKAFDIVVEMAKGLERGFWNNLYLIVLKAFSRPKFLKRFSAANRRNFYSAYGICLSRGNNPADAFPWAKRLLLASMKGRDHWGVSQAYLLFGLAHQHVENYERAAHFYEKCTRYAKRHRNYFLVGHALHNLAMLKSHNEPAEAEKLFQQSITAKKKAGDEPGTVGVLFGKGSLAVSQRQYEAAQKWFTRAEKLAAKWDMQHTRALALYNIGNALVDQDKPHKALSYYAEAKKIADAEGYADASAYAIGGAANANLALKRFTRACDLFLHLKSVRDEMGDHEAAVVAHHDAGACLLFHKRPADARIVFHSAYEEAVKHELPEWIYRCAKDKALTYQETGDCDRALRELCNSARREYRKRRYLVSAKLWESVATVLHHREPASPAIERAFENAIRSLEKSGENFEERLRLIGVLFQHRWDAGRFEIAIDALRMMEQVAKESRNREMEARATDQIGMCFQQLGKIAEAIPFHRVALRIARSLPNTEVSENCLNNLGEALRNSGKSEAAIPLFVEAETLARKRLDREAEVSIAHNRALALEDLGLQAQALRVLIHCRDESFKNEFWDQYVRALHGLANHTWLTSKVEDAVLGYREAFAEARRHKLDDQAASIALNYANALRYTAQNKEAFRVLESVDGRSPQSSGNHEYYSALAVSSAEIGNKARAKDAFVAALRAADAVNDNESAASAAGSLAELLEEEADWDGADDLLKKVLATEVSNKHKAALLIQRLSLLLRAGRKRQAGSVFRQIQDLTSAAGLNEESVDAHMMLGDHEWEYGKSKTKAMNAYIAAFIPASAIGIGVMIQTGMHAMRRLVTWNVADRVQQIERVRRALQGWLAKEVRSDKQHDAEAIALWPLRIAIRIAGNQKDLALSDTKQMMKLLEEEIFEFSNRPPNADQTST